MKNMGLCLYQWDNEVSSFEKKKESVTKNARRGFLAFSDFEYKHGCLFL